MSNTLPNMLENTISKIREMVDVNSVIGEPITTPDGVQVYSLSEARELTFSSNGVTLTVVIENGEVFVKESDCPDGVCVAGGRISKSGETILCAPAKILLTVKGGDGNVDFVAG